MVPEERLLPGVVVVVHSSSEEAYRLSRIEALKMRNEIYMGCSPTGYKKCPQTPKSGHETKGKSGLTLQSPDKLRSDGHKEAEG